MTVKGPGVFVGTSGLPLPVLCVPLLPHHSVYFASRLQRAGRGPWRANSHYPTSPGPSNHAAPHSSPAPALVCFEGYRKVPHA